MNYANYATALGANGGAASPDAMFFVNQHGMIVNRHGYTIGPAPQMAAVSMSTKSYSTCKEGSPQGHDALITIKEELKGSTTAPEA